MNSQPVYNLNSPIIDLATGKLLPPWNIFFQQLTQLDSQPIEFIDIPPLSGGFTYIASISGTMLVSGGSLINITLSRANTDVVITNSAYAIPMSKDDKLSLTFSVNPTLIFIPA